MDSREMQRLENHSIEFLEIKSKSGAIILVKDGKRFYFLINDNAIVRPDFYAYTIDDDFLKLYFSRIVVISNPSQLNTLIQLAQANPTNFTRMLFSP